MSRPGRDKLYISETPDEVKNAKGLHLITMNTPNGQAVQIMLEELADAYGTQWTTTLINIMTNEQKKEWYVFSQTVIQPRLELEQVSQTRPQRPNPRPHRQFTRTPIHCPRDVG